MARFKYSMQNVLDVKYKLEEQAKTEYNVAQMNVNEAWDVLQQFHAKKEFYQNEKIIVLQGILDQRKIEEATYGIETMEYYIVEQEKKLVLLNKRLEETREKLQEMMIDRKTHEKLKEREFEAFKQELNATEKKEIDELVSYQFNQPNKEE